MKRILVVDDESIVLKVIGTMVKRMGYCCDLAMTGEEALKYLADGDYSVILLDIHLPDIIGTDLLKQFYSKRPDQQVLIISGSAPVEVEDLQIMFNKTIPVLTKPFSYDELQEQIDHLVYASDFPVRSG